MEEDRVLRKVSVGLVLEARKTGRLVLVHNRGNSTGDSLGWGLIAGGVNQKTPIQAVIGEVLEEAGIKPRNVVFSCGEKECRPRVFSFFSPRGEKNLGLVYSAEYCGPRLPSEGWEIREDVDVDWARPFLPMEVARLVDNRGKKYRGIYRKEINEQLFINWLVEKAGSSKEVSFWLDEQVGKLPGLRRDYLFSDNFLYHPPDSEWVEIRGGFG